MKSWGGSGRITAEMISTERVDSSWTCLLSLSEISFTKIIEIPFHEVDDVGVHGNQYEQQMKIEAAAPYWDVSLTIFRDCFHGKNVKSYIYWRITLDLSLFSGKKLAATQIRYKESIHLSFCLKSQIVIFQIYIEKLRVMIDSSGSDHF